MRYRVYTSSDAIVGLILMGRPPNLVLMAVAVLVGYVVASKTLDSTLPLLFASLTSMTMTAFANVTNDIADLKIDAVNEPNRPLPSGRVSMTAAQAFSALLLISGLAFALLTGITLNLALALVAAALATAYNFKLKSAGLVGNVIVSALVALPFLYGAILSGGWLEGTLLVLIATSFLATLGREVHKGIVDVQGDAGRGIATVAVSYGVGSAKKLATSMYVSAICLSFLPLIINSVAWFYYLPLILIVDLGFLRSSVSVLRESSRERIRREKRLVLIWMGLAQLAFVAGRYWG